MPERKSIAIEKSIKREKREKGEESSILLEKREEEENEDYLEAIIDTGCRASICGEL